MTARKGPVARRCGGPTTLGTSDTMVQINFALKEVNCKVVYYGPGMSGKTTNLEIVHQKAPEENKGELTSISSDLQPYVDSPLGKKINPAYTNLLGRTPRGEDFDMAKRTLSTQRFLDSI